MDVAQMKIQARNDLEMTVHLLLNCKVDINGCWVWTRSRHIRGYGETCYKKRLTRVHRLAAQLWLGFKPAKGLCVLHRCDNPPCFNPDHLFVGSHSDNMKDAEAKGRNQNKPSVFRPGHPYYPKWKKR